MRHAMIDIETLGVTADAVVTQIGAVIIETYPSKRLEDECKIYNEEGTICILEDKFLRSVELESSLDKGTIDAKTLQFWAKQDQKTYLDTLSGDTHLYTALVELNSYLLNNKVDYYWANGILFDFGILENKYNKMNELKPHWPFYALMDYRTIRKAATSLGWNEADITANQQAHNALADAIYQANCLISMHNQSFINLNNIGGRNNV